MVGTTGVLDTPGIKVALAGGGFFLVSTISLLFLPHIVSAVGMMGGGMGVWIGFIMTILSWYQQPHPPEDEPPSE